MRKSLCDNAFVWSVKSTILKLSVTENRESATAHPSVSEMSHHGAEEDGKRNEKSMSVPAPSLLPQPAQSLQSDKELLQPEKPCDSQETLVPPSKQPKLHGKERKKEDVERENLGDVVGRMEDDLHVPFLLSPLPPSPTPVSVLCMVHGKLKGVYLYACVCVWVCVFTRYSHPLSNLLSI